jgi:cytochrome P450
VGNVINSILFGYIFHEQDQAGYKRFLHFVDIIQRFLITMITPMANFYQAWPWLTHVPGVNSTYRLMQREFASYMEFIRREVDAQSAEFNPHEPVNTFVQAYLTEMAKGENPHLRIEQLYSVSSDFWLAGMETSSTTLNWALLYLVKYPRVQALAHEEVVAVVGRDRYVTMGDKQRMPYVSALIHEVQRVPGIVEFTFRHIETAQRISGKTIPADTSILFLLPSIMNGPPFVDATEFRPERFLDTTATDGGKTLRRELVQQMIPFGMGRRQCPGEALAKMELFLILTTLVQKYEFSAIGEVDMTPIHGEILYPKRQVLRMVKRA